MALSGSGLGKGSLTFVGVDQEHDRGGVEVVEVGRPRAEVIVALQRGEGREANITGVVQVGERRPWPDRQPGSFKIRL